jgi:hypothetical protein
MISGCDIKDLMFHNETGGYPLFQKKKKSVLPPALLGLNYYFFFSKLPFSATMAVGWAQPTSNEVSIYVKYKTKPKSYMFLFGSRCGSVLFSFFLTGTEGPNSKTKTRDVDLCCVPKPLVHCIFRNK